MSKHLSILIIAVIFIATSACNRDSAQPLPIACSEDRLNTTASSAWIDNFTMKFPDGIFNPGFTRRGWWIKTTVQNYQSSHQDFILAFNNPHINELKIYINGDTIPAYAIGDSYVFNQRVVKDRDLVVPISLKTGESAKLLIWVNKKGESLQLKLELFEKNAFHNKSKNEKLLMGIIIGWFILIFIICMFLWINLKDALHLIYGGYVMATLGWVVSNWGLGFEYCWSDMPGFASKARPIFLYAAISLFSLAIVHLNPNKKKNDRLTQLHYSLIYVSLAIIVLSAVSNFEKVNADIKFWFLTGTSVFVIVWLILCVFLLQKIKQNGFEPVSYFNFAMGFTVFIFIGINLYQFGIDSDLQQFLNVYGSSLGLLGETTIIAYGLTFRYNHFMKEREALAKKILLEEKNIAENLIRIQEEERIKIGRELHDSLGSSLAALQINVEKLQFDQPAVDFSVTKAIIHASIKESRDISHGLVFPSLNNNGLEAALSNQVELMQGDGSPHYLFYFDCSVVFSTPVSAMIFRICCELLNNAAKHASATEISLQFIETENSIQLIVEDNGVGMGENAVSNGIGLRNIRYRTDYLKGNMNIDSNKNGTTFIIEFPKDHADA